jgi:Flp pilus assembly protein TadG
MFNDRFSVFGLAGMAMTSVDSSNERASALGRSRSASNATVVVGTRGTTRPPGLLRRFLRHSGGNPLVQFALVAPVFFALIFMIVDDGIAVFTQATLDNATRDAARNVLLGTYQKNGSSNATNLASFRTAVCNEMAGLIPNCTGNLLVYIQNDTSFSNLSTDLTTNPLPGSDGTFSLGSASSYVVVETAYNRSYIPFIGRFVTGGSLLLTSTIVFQTEPYS